MRIDINPKYKHLQSFLENLPENFNVLGSSLYKGRNEIKTIEIDGIILNVKSFKVPHLVNKIAYTYIRKSKAEKSFKYGLKLQDLGINTPEPVASIVCYKNGLICHSYYISLQFEYDYTIRELIIGKIPFNTTLLEDFTQFTFDNHQKGVLHQDYSPGNILIKQLDEETLFSMVDINRLKFKQLSLVDKLKNFSQLWADEEFLKIIARKYAQLSQMDSDYVEKQIINFDQIHKAKKLRKKKIKSLFKKN
ncbi:hypothetical protein DWB61_08805 [Ancylomarina euxinus]|uniref:Protein kinase domain-containing protein n=1 Tax=Ancylomarina euxinus TaxID=2283627 RepID=A0A425Y1S5_9BACT|nr:hypothetical protein [Ancylomarina euxinus]MCZ4695114.1 hypothetical protein [Ancylomarina euxinus]MUP14950.1 hypothetical protein [Ancylomarina euxinus]RRG21842.1 hypothetical protein DWB61_08805 [Ancylomarina euxinus]